MEDEFGGRTIRIGRSVYRYGSGENGSMTYVRIKGDFEGRITIHKGGMMIVSGMFIPMEMEAIIRYWRRYIAEMHARCRSDDEDE